MIVHLPASKLLAMTVALLALGTIMVTSDPALRVLTIACAGIASFATRSLPDTVTALAIFLAFIAIDAAPHATIFSGFASSGFWLLVGGLVIGSAITASELGDQIARLIFALTGTSYRRAVLFLSLGGLLLGACVPSAIPRVIVMMPITLALAARMSFCVGTRQHTGLLMAAALMTLIPTYAFLTANLPTIVEVGIIETLYDIQFTYGAYFIQNAPINALRFVVLLVLLLAWGGSPDIQPAVIPAAQADDEPAPLWTQAQRRLSWLLAIAIFLWATDTLHGIAPAWITLAVALVLLVPATGVFTAQAMKSDIDLSIGFLIAAVFSIGAVMTDVGLSHRIAEIVVPMLRLTPDTDLWNLTVITLFSSGLSHLTIAPATPIVLAPLAAAMAQAADWPIEAVAMAHNIGISTTILPYQSPPLLIGLAIAAIPVGPLTRICMLSAFFSTVLGLPLTFAWWGAIGLI